MPHKLAQGILWGYSHRIERIFLVWLQELENEGFLTECGINTTVAKKPQVDANKNYSYLDSHLMVVSEMLKKYSHLNLTVCSPESHRVLT